MFTRSIFVTGFRNPRVNIVNAEGRHYLSTVGEQFDVIQLSGVDSYSGTPGAAQFLRELPPYGRGLRPLPKAPFSEWRDEHDCLEHAPAREMLRALTTAVAALRRLGINEEPVIWVPRAALDRLSPPSCLSGPLVRGAGGDGFPSHPPDRTMSGSVHSDGTRVDEAFVSRVGSLGLEGLERNRTHLDG